MSESVAELGGDPEGIPLDRRRRYDVSLRHMTVVLEAVTEIARPAEAAQVLARLNNRLAHEATIPPDICRAVGEVATGVTRTALTRWQGVDPYLSLVIHRAVIQAEEAVRDPDDPAARDSLRIALESMRQGFASIAESQPVADERSPKEIARWLAERTEVPQNRLAELFGVSLRQLQRWVSPHERAQP